MTRINAVRSIEVRNTAVRTTAQARNSVTWGSKASEKFAIKHAGALIFAAVLIVCSVTVGCSSNSDKPKPVSSNSQIPVMSPANSVSPAPVLQAEAKPAPKKIVHKKPATVNYTDQTYGLTFEYPRRYAIETGNAATELLAENPIAMNFVQPGGVALAAVELPETNFANTDFSSAFFNVSVNKALTADQCTEFAVPQPKVSESQPPQTEQSAQSTQSALPSQTCHPEDRASCGPKDPMPAVASTSSDGSSNGNTSAPVAATASAQPSPSTVQLSVAKTSNGNSKLMLGDLELRATEAVSGEGTRQSDSKYFHVFQSGSCYEFALNVTTNASEDGIVKHVDRDKVFNRLEQILSTVKIDPVKVDTTKTDAVKANPVATPEVTAEAPAATPADSPAQ